MIFNYFPYKVDYNDYRFFLFFDFTVRLVKLTDDSVPFILTVGRIVLAVVRISMFNYNRWVDVFLIYPLKLFWL
jgi:hypothetical protein